MAVFAMSTSKAMRQDAALEVLFKFFVYVERYWFFIFFEPGFVMLFDDFEKNCFLRSLGLYTASDFFGQLSAVIGTGVFK